MYTDMVGYTVLGQENEPLSVALVNEQRKLIRPILKRHDGREIKTMGDAFLVEFPNALDAVRCAYDIQRAIREFDVSLPEEKRIHLRVGLHLGDVIESNGDILGDAVNIASRIEPLAEGGGVCLTREVYETTHNKLGVHMVSIGMKSLKNVSEPVEVYRMEMPWAKEIAESLSLPKPNRVAVLPFVSMSPDPNDEYFADGLTEELIMKISQMKGLEVIARTSVMSFKKKDNKISEIGTALRVGTLLEGSVRKAGNRIRVSVQLINANTESHLWGQNYDRSLEDIFEVQSEIAEKVAGGLKAQSLGAEEKAAEKKPTENMEAYLYYLRGRELSREITEPSLREALSLFERAVELDPSFSRACVGISSCHLVLSDGGYEPIDVMLPAVKSSLHRALELDPDLAEAHAQLAHLRYEEENLPGCEAEARRALELNPSLPEAYNMLFEVAAVKGEPEEMVKNIETAYRLDPIAPIYIHKLGFAYYATGMEHEALEHWRRTEHLAPALTYSIMRNFYASKGDVAKAREFHSRFEKLQPTDPEVISMGGFIDALAGDREKALLAIKKIEERKIGPVAYNDIAAIYCALGDMDKYFQYMNRAEDENGLIYAFFLYSPLLAKSRNDSRYPELVARIKSRLGMAN